MATVEKSPPTSSRRRVILPPDAVLAELIREHGGEEKIDHRSPAEVLVDETVEAYSSRYSSVPSGEDTSEFVLKVRARAKEFGAKVVTLFMSDVIARDEDTLEAVGELRRFRKGYIVNPILVTCELTAEQRTGLSEEDTHRLVQLEEAMDGLELPAIRITPPESS